MINRLSTLKTKVDIFSGRIKEKESRLEAALSNKKSIEEVLPSLREAVLLAKKCLEESLEQRKYIEEIVSSALTEVFGSTFTFILEPQLDTAGTIKGLKPRLKEEGGEFDEPLASFGASSAAIASLCFRISILLLSTGTAKIIILDEPLANVSPSLQDRFKAFIENICKETGLQLIMVTHMDQPFGKVYQVTKDIKKGNKGGSKVQDITSLLKDNE